MSDIDTVVVDSLKALDPEWPIREVDIDEQVLALPGFRSRKWHDHITENLVGGWVSLSLGRNLPAGKSGDLQATRSVPIVFVQVNES